MSTPMQSEVNKIFGLIEEKKTKESIDLTAQLLESKDLNLHEALVNNLNKIYDKCPQIIKTLLPKILNHLNEKDDMLRYSIVLALKPVCNSEPALILPFYHAFIKDQDANKRESIIRLVGFIAREHPEVVKEYIPDLIGAIKDEKEFVQDQAVETLKTLGRTFSREIETKLLEFLSSTTSVDVKKKGEIILKSFVQVAALEKEQLEGKQVDARAKELEIKQKELEKKEQELKAKELEEKAKDLEKRKQEEEKRKQEEEKRRANEQKSRDLQAKLEELRKKEELLKMEEIRRKEEELAQWDAEFTRKHQDELETLAKQKEAEAKLMEELKAKEATIKTLEQELRLEELKRKEEQLRRAQEIERKKAELKLVQQELELKALELAQEEIKKKEEERIKKEMEKMMEKEKQETKAAAEQKSSSS